MLTYNQFLSKMSQHTVTVSDPTLSLPHPQLHSEDINPRAINVDLKAAGDIQLGNALNDYPCGGNGMKMRVIRVIRVIRANRVIRAIKVIPRMC